jgi:hypothetical protein
VATVVGASALSSADTEPTPIAVSSTTAVQGTMLRRSGMFGTVDTCTTHCEWLIRDAIVASPILSRDE